MLIVVTGWARAIRPLLDSALHGIYIDPDLGLPVHHRDRHHDVSDRSAPPSMGSPAGTRTSRRWPWWAPPLRTRRTDQPLTLSGDTALVFDHRPVFDHLPVRSFVVSPERIVDSEFNRAHTGAAQRIGYSSVEQFFDSILNCLRATRQPSYTYAYYADFDSIAHQHGVGSPQADFVLRRFDMAFSAFLRAAAGLDATVLVTADHGFVDSPADRLIELQDHPLLEAMLRLPLCGERRAAYCYVRPDQAHEFEDYVRRAISEQAWAYRSERLIEEGWFGPGEPHPKLKDRIGDLVSSNWMIKDCSLAKRLGQIGVHGMSADKLAAGGGTQLTFSICQPRHLPSGRFLAR